MFFWKIKQVPCQISFNEVCAKIENIQIKCLTNVYISKKNGENILILIPKTTSIIVHNSFVPYIRLAKSGDNITIEYSLRKFVFLPFAFIISVFFVFGISSLFLVDIGVERILIATLSISISIIYPFLYYCNTHFTIIINLKSHLSLVQIC